MRNQWWADGEGFRMKPQRWDKVKGYTVNRLSRTAAAKARIKERAYVSPSALPHGFVQEYPPV